MCFPFENGGNKQIVIMQNLGQIQDSVKGGSSGGS